MTGSYAVMLVFTLVASVFINSYALPMNSDRQRLPAATTGVNRSDQPSTDEGSAVKKRMNMGTSRSSHVHGCPRNRVTEVRTATTVSASKDLSKKVVKGAVSKSLPVQLVQSSTRSHVSRASSMVSSVKQVSKRGVKRPPSTTSKSPSRQVYKRNRLHKISKTNQEVVTVSESLKAKVGSKNVATRSHRINKRILPKTTESPDCECTTESPDCECTTESPDCDSTTLSSYCDESEEGLWYDVTTEDETISTTTDATDICVDNWTYLCIDRTALLVVIVIMFLLTLVAIFISRRKSEKCRPKEYWCMEMDKCDCHAHFMSRSLP